MNNVVYADPDDQLSAMCHRNHVDRAYLYEQEIPDAEYEPVQEEAKNGPVIHIFEGSTKETPTQKNKLVRNDSDGVEVPSIRQVKRDSDGVKVPSIRQVKRILGALARGGAGVMFLCGVADGLIDTTYGLMLTIICIGWGLLHLLGVVAHG